MKTYIGANDARELIRRVRDYSVDVERRLNEGSHDLLRVLQGSDAPEWIMAEGWQLAPYDPNELLACVDGVRIRPGFVLASYQYMSEGNGNGFVFAIPEGRRLPPPPENLTFSWDQSGAVRLHLPPEAADWIRPDFEGFLEILGTPLSYFACSIAVRELRELGAVWHGADWSAHKVLLSVAEAGSRGWAWKVPVPEEILPIVTVISDDTCNVEMYSFTEHLQARFFKHTDRYESGHFAGSRREVVATGGQGYIY